MVLKETARFWDIRFDVPHVYEIGQADGSKKEYKSSKHHVACVAAEAIAGIDQC